jgi:hypothetical protein
MALAVGGGSLVLQGVPGSTEVRDTTPVVADPAASDLGVLVDMDVPKHLSTLLDGREGEVAIWNPAERTLAFVPDMDYSGSCPPLATAESTAPEAVTLIVRGDPDTGPCTMDARHVTASITGLTTAPPDLTVTVSGETHTILVQSATGEPTQSVSGRIELPVGHCWIDPVRFDGTEWAVVPQDQFGWGGGRPDSSWDGKGIITRLSESRTRYVDRGGHVLRLVPADDPEAAAVFKHGCR